MDKNVLITGTSSGLGKETALKLAEEGYKVFAGVRKQADKESLESLHPNITAIFLDVTQDNSVNSAFEQISKQTDKLYALINNAGVALAGPVEYIPIDILKQQFDINVFGAIRVAQKFFPLLDEADSRIVNISSMSSYGIFPFVSPYCASKRALDMFFNSLLIECKKTNLKIVSIKPGVVKTPIWDKSLAVCEKNMEFLCDEGKKKYEQEFEFLTQNAKKNNNKGIDPKKVANVISTALKKRNPKLSYNVGRDSNFARLLSFLPQKIINSLIKFGLRARIQKSLSK